MNELIVNENLLKKGLMMDESLSNYENCQKGEL
jgi:hypothetical protein